MDQDITESYKVGESLPGNENSRSECSGTREAICDDGSQGPRHTRAGTGDLFGRSGCAQIVNTGAEFIQQACVSQNSLRNACVTGIPLQKDILQTMD